MEYGTYYKIIKGICLLLELSGETRDLEGGTPSGRSLSSRQSASGEARDLDYRHLAETSTTQSMYGTNKFK